MVFILRVLKANMKTVFFRLLFKTSFALSALEKMKGFMRCGLIPSMSFAQVKSDDARYFLSSTIIQLHYEKFNYFTQR